ncbi:MAG: PKD domain-containing protein [Bacteroidales bacterium]|nr:PKD domain-containing protein [Lentimicrobiaceae bacterium]MDD5695960.1 PKD domain-containing protein [Bacteroidales bacterium]
MKKSILLLLTVMVCFSPIVHSQVLMQTTGKAHRYAKVHFDQIKKYDAAHPSDSSAKLKKPKPLWVPPTFPIDPDEVIYREPPRDDTPLTLPLEGSPAPTLNFQGIGDNQTAIPPDTKGVAGLNHIMVTLNTEVRIQDKLGNNLSTVSLSSFWSEFPGSSGTFDPNLMFDPYENRWIFVVVKNSTPSTSEIFVAVSASENPMDEWYLYAFDSDPLDYTWCDFPSIGFNKNWVVVSGNMFTASNGYQNAALWVIEKDDLYAGISEPAYARIVPSNGFTIAPSMTYDPNMPNIYLITNYDGSVGGSGYLRKYRIKPGMFGEPILENQGTISAADPWGDNYPQNNGNISPQQGTSQRIDGGDSRIHEVTYRNGYLWFTHTIFLPASNPSRCSVQWWQVDTLGTIIQRGRVDDPSGTMFYSYPSISANGINEVLVSYSSFSSSQYASANYSLRTPDDPLNTLRDTYLYKNGEGPYYKTYGDVRNRWGDYSATSVDPMNHLDFWTLQEYASSPANTWGTWWAMLEREAAPVPQFSANITTVPVSTGVNFTDETLYEPTSWLWEFEGGEPSVSTEQNPSNIIYYLAGSYDVSLTVSNSVGTNTITKQNYITASTTILPEIDFSVEDPIVCLWDTITITDLTIYNPTSWNWTITPGDFMFTNGTSASSQNPQVIFTSPGVSTVKLMATNPNGSSTLTKENFISAGGTPLSFEETFEDGFTTKGWSILNPDDEITWDIATVAGTTPGNKAAYVDIRSYTDLRERDQLISPPLDFSAYSYVTMTFKHAYTQYYTSITDSLIIYISDDCQETWTRILALGEDGSENFITHPPMNTKFVPQSAEDWCGASTGPACNMVDLTPWAGKTDIRIMFECYSFFGNNLYLDNIVIYNSVGISPQEDKSILTIYPNPTGGLLNVKFEETGDNAYLRILNLQGQRIREIHILPGTLSLPLDLSDCPRGLYLLEFGNDKTVITRKLMLE